MCMQHHVGTHRREGAVVAVPQSIVLELAPWAAPGLAARERGHGRTDGRIQVLGPPPLSGMAFRLWRAKRGGGPAQRPTVTATESLDRGGGQVALVQLGHKRVRRRPLRGHPDQNGGRTAGHRSGLLSLSFGDTRWAGRQLGDNWRRRRSWNSWRLLVPPRQVLPHVLHLPQHRRQFELRRRLRSCHARRRIPSASSSVAGDCCRVLLLP